MTWRQSSGRDFKWQQSQTAPRVGPGSYNLFQLQKETIPKRNRQKQHFQERECIPKPDLITPGPGMYDTNIEYVQKPQSAVFKSRSHRDKVFRSTTPSPADYCQISGWIKPKNTSSNPHHPPRKIRSRAGPSELGNYLDIKGRLIHVDEITHTEVDIGPGTYDPQLPSYEHFTEINKESRKMEYWKLPSASCPSPDTYFINQNQSSRIPIKIGNCCSKTVQKPYTESIGKPIKNSFSMRPSPAFRSSVPRSSYQGSDRDVPGPGTFSPDDIHHSHKIQLIENAAFNTRSVRFEDASTPGPGPSEHGQIFTYTTQESRPTSQFASREIPRGGFDPSYQFSHVPGPGKYDTISSFDKRRSQLSPAFADGEDRMASSANGMPGPADHSYHGNMDRGMTVLSTRYPKVGNWQISDNCSPSPEKYNIDRSLHGRDIIMSKKINKTQKVKYENLGPGTYETNTSSFKIHSYNAGVPGAFPSVQIKK